MKAAWTLILLSFCAIAPAVSAQEPKNSAEKATAKAALFEEIRDRILWYSEKKTDPLLVPEDVFGLVPLEELPIPEDDREGIRMWISLQRDWRSPAGQPAPECRSISPCPVTTPRSSFSLFTSDRPLPGLPPLVPLYRVRFDPNTYWRCQAPPRPNVPGISFAYTTTVEGVEFFKNSVLARVEPDNPANTTRIGYDPDGILGYIFPRCSPEPECMPQGTTRLRRLYHPAKDDYIIVPDPETAYWLSQGYTETTTLATVLGYVYPNSDTDLDGLIDGYEDLLGTNKSVYDTDCDGAGDGTEILRYDSALHGYHDPLEGPCGYFYADGFETGDTARWSATTFLDDGVGF